MYSKVIFLVFLVLFACKKNDESSPILVMGHAGMGLHFLGSIYPDNSKEAIHLALNMEGSDGVEIDVRLSADGDLWAFHDETLDAATDNTGCIENLSFPDLKSTKYKGWSNEKLIRLKDLNLEPFKKRLFLDLRHANFCQQTIHPINQFLASFSDLPAYFKDDKYTRLIVSNPQWIADLIAAGYPVLFSSDDLSRIDQVIAENPSLQGIVIKNKSISEEAVQKYKNMDLNVFIYEVRSPKKIREVRMKNPTGVFSDDLQTAILELK